MDEIIDVKMLFIDEPTGRIFHASQKDIETAVAQINELIACAGCVTMEDYVKALGVYNKYDAAKSDMLQSFGVKDGPIEFIMDPTASGIKLSVNKKWTTINDPWDS